MGAVIPLTTLIVAEVRGSAKKTTTLVDPLPDEYRSAHGAVGIAPVRSGCNCQGISFEYQVDLIGGGPTLVPRRGDAVDDEVLLQRECARIDCHGAEQPAPTSALGTHHITRYGSIFPREDSAHPAVRRLPDVAHRDPEWMIAISSDTRKRRNTTATYPASDNMLGGQSGRCRRQSFVICRQVILSIQNKFETQSRSSKHSIYRSLCRSILNR